MKDSELINEDIKPKKEGSVNLSKEDLQHVLTEVIKAVKEPNAVEQRKLDEEEKRHNALLQERKHNAQGQLELLETKKQMQRLCTHEHADGFTHCVYVQEKIGPGYLICQKNQCIIRPGQADENYKGTVIYDNALFNRIFQKIRGSGELFG